MNVLVIVASLLSCCLAAPTDLLKAYELQPGHAIHHGYLGHPGLPLTHAVEVKAAEGEEVKALSYLSPFPYHHAPAHIVKTDEKVEVKAVPVLHAAPHHYPAEVRTFAVNHEPVVIPHVAPKVVEVEGHPSVYHTSYHAETKRVEHPVQINHHQVKHVQAVVHHAPAVVHHAPAVYHHAPAVYHAPAAYHHAGYAVKAEEKEE